MDPIYEISAAPHLPAPLNPELPKMRRPELLAGWLTLLFEDAGDVEITERNGEIYVLSTSRN